MRIIEDKQLDFNDVLILPKRSFLTSRSQVKLNREFVFPHSPKKINCKPIISSNMDTVGSFYMADTLGFFESITCLHKHYNVQDYVNFYNGYKFNSEFVFLSTGTSEKDIEKLEKIITGIENTMPENNKFTPNICVDVANGYTEQFVLTLEKIRKKYTNSIIMAGNVVTPEITEELILHGGVDIVKVGIGSGGVCTTRLKTGIGRPQLSAIIECADAAHGLGGHICSDGGCTTAGDICKAFGAGADFVMIGSMLAGTDECDGEWEYEYRCKTKTNDISHHMEWYQPIDPGYPTEKRKKSLKFYGMSSKEAQDKHNEGVADYRTSEGKCVNVPYKGAAGNVIRDILGGMRSCCTYVGCWDIKSLPKKTVFIKVNNTHNRIFEK